MHTPKTLHGLVQHAKQAPRLRLLHRFSDGALHTSLMLAVLALATLALAQAVNVGVSVWLLDPVVVQSQPKR